LYDDGRSRGPQINADERRYLHQDLTRDIIGVFFEVYNELGYGFLESVYREAMAMALREAGLEVYKDFGITARFRGRPIGEFKADLIVSGLIILELKAVRALEPAHDSQLLNYLRAGVLEIGLLLNFGPKPQFKRLVFSNERKHLSPARSISVHLR
jgi:GxxExxY protein